MCLLTLWTPPVMGCSLIDSEGSLLTAMCHDVVPGIYR